MHVLKNNFLDSYHSLSNPKIEQNEVETPQNQEDLYQHNPNIAGKLQLIV